MALLGPSVSIPPLLTGGPYSQRPLFPEGKDRRENGTIRAKIDPAPGGSYHDPRTSQVKSRDLKGRRPLAI